MHDTIMASRTASKWIKIPVIVLLDLATIVLFALALCETVIRMAIGIICLFFAALTYFCSEAITETLLSPIQGSLEMFNPIIPGILSTIRDLPTNTKNFIQRPHK